MSSSWFSKLYNSSSHEDTYASTNIRDEVIMKLISKRYNYRILDVGIGNNTFIYDINPHKSIMRYCVDLSKKNVNYHRKRGVFAHVYDLNEGLPDFGVKFDSIFCFEVLEHLLEGKKLLKDIKKALSNHGRLYLTVPNDTGYIKNRLQLFFTGNVYFNHNNFYEQQHIRFFTKKHLIKLIKDSGLKIEYFSGINTSLPNTRWNILFSLIPFKTFLASRFPSLFATNYLVVIKK